MKLIPQGEPPVYFTFPGLARLGLPHATTTRHCPGIAAWSESKGPFHAEAARGLAGAGLDLGRVAWARQVHGAEEAFVGARGGFAGAADVLVTTENGVPLTIFTADCLALLLYDPTMHVLGAAHVGWRGTVAGAAQAAVTAMIRTGARAEGLHVGVAPSIGPCCYEVDEPVVARFRSAYPGSSERWLRPTRPGHWMLDLWAANEALLRGAGVPAERIENPRLCTACHTDLLYSYRRRHRGRLLTLAALPS